MRTRVDLQSLLEEILGNTNVYFQPPDNLEINYPCIIYMRDYIKPEYADNSTYSFAKRYEITLIDKDPDSAMVDKLASLPMCSFDRHFTSDNLNHDVFNLYF